MGKHPTDSKNISKEKIAEGFKRALSNSMPVLKNIGDLDEKYPGKYKEEYPEGWTDPLELYGCYLKELHLTEEEKAKERITINEFIDRHSAKWVWENRLWLVAETIYIRNCF